jgi:hypothetical protein
MPPCTCSSGGSPTRSRAPFSSRRPCSSPFISSGRASLHIRSPTRVRARTPPSAYTGKPGSPIGSTCGTSVAHGRSSSSAASAAATVRMSATTISGSSSRITRAVTADARTAAAYGLRGRSRVGNT